MARAKLNRDGKGGRKSLVMGNYSINIWDGSEMELVWSKKSSLSFENNFPICLLSGILNTSIFKVHDVFTLSKFLRN